MAEKTEIFNNRILKRLYTYEQPPPRVIWENIISVIQKHKNEPNIAIKERTK